MSQPLPAPTFAPTDDDAALVGYRATFRERQRHWLAILERNAERLARGQYSLHWLDTERANWGR